MENKENNENIVSSNQIESISDLEAILTKVKEIYNSLQQEKNSVFYFEHTYMDKSSGGSKKEQVSESTYVRMQVSKMYQMGLFTYESRNNMAANTGDSEKIKKNPVDFTTVEELISFIQSKIEPLKKKLAQKKELEQTRQKKASIEERIEEHHYFSDLKEIRNFTNSSVNNLLLYSIRSNPNIPNLLNKIVEKFKGTNEYDNIRNMVNYCKANGYTQLGIVLKTLRDKISLISKSDMVEFLKAEELISQLKLQSECINRNVLINSFKRYPHMQETIKKFFGSRQVIHVQQLFREFDSSLMGYFQHGKIEDISQLQNSRQECERKISELESQNLDDDRISDTYNQLNQMLNEANGVKRKREEYYQTASRNEHQQLITQLELSDKELLTICMDTKYDKILEIERNIDNLAKNNYTSNKQRIDEYISNLSDIYYDVIYDFMRLKKEISLTVYAYGTKSRYSEDIKKYSDALESIYNGFKEQFEKSKNSLGLITKLEVSKSLPGSSKFKNGIFFTKKPILYRSLRIQRHKLIFDDAMANFQEFYRKLSSPMSKPIKKPSIYTYSYIMNPPEEDELLDINGILSDRFYETSQDEGLRQNDLRDDTDGKKKK